MSIGSSSRVLLGLPRKSVTLWSGGVPTLSLPKPQGKFKRFRAELMSHSHTLAPLNTRKRDILDGMGTWGGHMSLEYEASLKHGAPVPKIEISAIGHCSDQGKRPSLEDRFVIEQLTPEVLLCAVFDGHGGQDCAVFCAAHFSNHVKFWLDRDQDLENVLVESFLGINNGFSKSVVFSTRFKEEETSSGSTATIALLRRGTELVIGHVGDSYATLSRNGEAQKLTVDHVPSLTSEKKRIEESGGRVTTDSLGRPLVNARLAMTRSLGDTELKHNGVIALPYTRTIQVRHGKDNFLYLSTDGIHDVMRNQEICDVIGNCSDAFEAAHSVVQQAMSFNAQDNLTIVIVPFGSWGQGSRSSSIFYSFGRSFTMSSRYG
ncbi:unnamed protein product, partial [Darwinula stevensoni]